MNLFCVFLCALSSSALRLSVENQVSKNSFDSHTAIFGMACGYPPERIAPFLTSLKKSGYIGTLHLGGGEELEEYAQEHGIVLHREPCDEQAKAKDEGQFFIIEDSLKQLTAFNDIAGNEASELLQEDILEGNFQRFSKYDRFVTASQASHFYKSKGLDPPASFEKSEVDKPWFGSLNQMRWTHYKEWAQQGNYSAIWAVDVRDVFFQTNPFSTKIDLTGTNLHLFQHYSGMSHWITFRIHECIDLNASGPKWVEKASAICAGTVLGTLDAFIDLCDSMNAVIGNKRKQQGDCKHNDEPFLTYIVNERAKSNKLNSVQDDYWHIHENFDGPAVNVMKMCDKGEEHKNQHNMYINTDNEVIPVIHGFDACQNQIKNFTLATISARQIQM